MPLAKPEPWQVLLPCPFCGARAAFLDSVSMHADSGVLSSCCVICTSKACGADGGMIEPREPAPTDVMHRRAAAKWNRRSTHQSADWKLRRIAQILNSTFVEVQDVD